MTDNSTDPAGTRPPAVPDPDAPVEATTLPVDTGHIEEPVEKDGVLDRVRRALHNDIEQTAHNIQPGDHGQQLHQTTGDTIKQMLGLQSTDRPIDDDGAAPHKVLGYSDDEEAEIVEKIAETHDGVVPTSNPPTT